MARARKAPDYRTIARQIAKQVGVPESLFLALIQQESGFNPRAGSPAGAKGLTQLMPGTARGLGVRDIYDPVQNLQGGARYLKTQLQRFGDPRLALSAYNSGPGGAEAAGRVENFTETQNYVKNVMALESQYRGAGEGVPGGPPVPPMNAPTGAPTMPSILDTTDALAPNPLETTAGPGLPSLIDLIGRASPMAAQQYSTLAGQMQQQEAPAEVPGMPMLMSDDDDAGPVGDAAGNWQEWVQDPDPREGPSAHHTPAILRAVGMLGQRMGKKLAPWGNESHSKMTTSGRVSAHFSGNAADIPGSGKQLAEMGRQALIMAGMSPQQAEMAAKRGGLYNVGPYQIIFNTNEGGNHYDHLHLGLRR
jgi:Transglycosylase SLT domain